MSLQTLKVPNSHWKSMENRRNFLDEIAKKLNVKTPSDWGKITTRHFRDLGGASLLTYYDGSLIACLQSVYKDINWKREWFINIPRYPNSYWKSMENRKNFLDEIAKKLNIKTPSDWGIVTAQQFYELGGSSMLRYYNGSLFACLQSVYKDTNWKREWFDNLSQFPKAHWDLMENRKNFLDEIAKKLNIKTPSDWGKVTFQRLHEHEGASLLNNYYNGSLFACLQSVYKDINWKREWFENLDRLPKSYWKSMENRRNFLDEMAKKLNIKTPSDWGKVTRRRFDELGGSSLLSLYYNNSLFACLQSVYKDTNWKREWFDNIDRFPSSYWKSMENRKNFLDEIAKKLNIKTPSDWGKVTLCRLHELGAGSLLNNYYQGSLIACLQSVYKDVNWKKEWFENLDRLPNSHWKSMENRKNFLDEVAKKLNIKIPSDWGKITTRQFFELGGSSLLKYYNGSLFACLQSVYKDIHWKTEWFDNLPQLPKLYWKSMENRKNFLDEIAKKLNIKTPSDWGIVTIHQIYELGGISMLNNYYKGSLFACLQSVYKDTNWKREWFRVTNKIFPQNHFQNFKNQLRFFDTLVQQYNLQNPSDWKMISLNLIKKRGGGPLLAQYNNSISNALNAIYPSMNLLLSQNASHPQKKAINMIQGFK